VVPLPAQAAHSSAPFPYITVLFRWNTLPHFSQTSQIMGSRLPDRLFPAAMDLDAWPRFDDIGDGKFRQGIHSAACPACKGGVVIVHR